MRKVLRNRNMNALLACALAASLAAFGCTTNSMPGEGQPWLGGPGAGPSSPSSTYGTSVPTTPPPMTSSYTRSDEQGSVITTRSSRTLPLSPDEAAAIVAQIQPRVRVLGPADPGPGNRPYASDALIARYENVTNPQQYTVNSSLTSAPVPGISSGVTTDLLSETGAAIFTEPLSVTTPTTISATVPPTTTAATTSATPATGTTTVAPSTTRTRSVATTAATGRSSVRLPAVRTGATAKSTNGPVRAITANGRVVITNAKSQ